MAVQSYKQFVSSGMKKVDSGVRRIGPQKPTPGRPGRPKPGFDPPKPPKPKTKLPYSVNEFLGVEEHIVKKNINELSKYLKMDETDLCDIIYSNIVGDEKYSDETIEQINKLAYSYGLI